jgi:hypothetical protein
MGFRMTWSRGMQTLKSVLGIVGALVPIVYCGGLLYYFLDLTGSVSEAEANGLGPTLMGLAIVGLLFCIPLIVKLVRIFLTPRSPGPGGRRHLDTSTHESDGDADAAIARYLAQRSAEAAAPPPAQEGIAPTTRPTFGRKIR